MKNKSCLQSCNDCWPRKEMFSSYIRCRLYNKITYLSMTSLFNDPKSWDMLRTFSLPRFFSETSHKKWANLQASWYGGDIEKNPSSPNAKILTSNSLTQISHLNKLSKTFFWSPAKPNYCNARLFTMREQSHMMC